MGLRRTSATPLDTSLSSSVRLLLTLHTQKGLLLARVLLLCTSINATRPVHSKFQPFFLLDSKRAVSQSDRPCPFFSFRVFALGTGLNSRQRDGHRTTERGNGRARKIAPFEKRADTSDISSCACSEIGIGAIRRSRPRHPPAPAALPVPAPPNPTLHLRRSPLSLPPLAASPPV